MSQTKQSNSSSHASVDAAEILSRHSASLAEPLLDAVVRATQSPALLSESIRYSLTAGGKRLRPALVMESCAACGGSPTDASALSAAVAIELIHTFSLVHDDLPAMDDDDLRRGRPTNHKVYGEAMAILAGDAMVTLAFETIANDADPKLVGPLVRELAWASGPEGMIGGQALDIDGENKSLTLPELQRLHRMKTGALLMCACRMGAIAAGSPPETLKAITAYGRHLGLAFQIVDDLLDVTATPEQMGKATKKDADSGKNTYPGLIGMSASQTAAKEAVDAAIATLAELGSSADGLRSVARFVLSRQS